MQCEPSFDGLALLLDGYLHEDFRTEFGDHEPAARAFASEASPEELVAASEALTAFVGWAESRDARDWQAALTRIGGAWRPRSLAPLHEVLAILAGDS